jgi:protein-S-isoprenylcysteine O-methyltransferase Ste14
MNTDRLELEVVRFFGTRAFTLFLIGLPVTVLNLPISPQVTFGPFVHIAGISLILVTKISDFEGIWAFWVAGGKFYGHPPERLVNSGPYRYVRNPLYLTLFTDVFGLFLIFEQLWYLVILVFLVIGIHLMVVTQEEPDLEKRFGESYVRYGEIVPRWIPRLPAWS